MQIDVLCELGLDILQMFLYTKCIIFHKYILKPFHSNFVIGPSNGNNTSFSSVLSITVSSNTARVILAEAGEVTMMQTSIFSNLFYTFIYMKGLFGIYKSTNEEQKRKKCKLNFLQLGNLFAVQKIY